MTDNPDASRKASPRVSVVIVNYNSGRYLVDAVETVLGQDIDPRDMEVLVVDDGSTDDPVARVRPYLGRIRLIVQPNSGQVAACNRGFREARGEFIAVLESDDLWRKDKIRRSVELLERNPGAALVQHWLEQTDAAGRPLPGYQYPPGPAEFGLADVLWGRTLYAGTSALVFRADALRPFLPLPETMRYCADICLRAIAATLGPLLNIPETLGRRRIHDQNLFGKTVFDDPDKLQIGFQIHPELMKFYRDLLSRQKIAFDPEYARFSELEGLQMQLFLHRYRRCFAAAWRSWWKIVRASGPRGYSLFKGATLFLALVSPRLYLFLHRSYARVPWGKKLRRALFPFG
jgi:glycosyltransferase involved in cell wall biosynthesis